MLDKNGLASCLVGAVLLILTVCLPAKATDDQITVRGADTSIILIAELAQAYEQKTGHAVAVEGGASAEDPTACLDSGVDISVVRGELSEEKTSQGVVAVDFAHDAAAIVVSSDSPLSNLTISEVQDIFAGRTIVWQDQSPIEVYMPPFTTTARRSFEQVVLDPGGFGSHIQIGDEFTVLEQVKQNPNAIGLLSMGWYLSSGQVSALSIDGITPSPATVVDKTYPISTTLTLTTKSQPHDRVQAFVNFVLSQEGQQIIQDAGLVPVAAPQQVQTAGVQTEASQAE